MRSFSSYLIALATASLGLVSVVSADSKGVFAHYMVWIHRRSLRPRHPLT